MKGDVDGDGTPAMSGVSGIGQAVSAVATDATTTGPAKAEAIHRLIRSKKFVDREVPSNR